MREKPVQWTADFGKIRFWRQYSSAGLWLPPMWENAGTALADLGDLASPFTLAGVTLPSWTGDALGVALLFDGTSSRCDMNTPIGFGSLVANGSFTVFAVVRPNAVGALRMILGDAAANATAFSLDLRQQATDVWAFSVGYSGGNDVVNGTAPVVNGALAVLVGTWDLSVPGHHMQTLYTNGNLDGAGDFLARTQVNGTALTVGRNGAYSDNYFSGNILLVGAQKGVWTPTQIAQFSADPFGVITQQPTIPFQNAKAPPTLAPGISILQQPYRVASSGVPLVQQPVVQVVDAHGYPIAGIPVTASIMTGDDVLTGTKTVVTDAQGVARYTDLAYRLPNHTDQFVFEAPNGMQSAMTPGTTVTP